MTIETSPDVLGGSRIEKLIGVHPKLVEAIKRILYAMNDLGYHMIVTDGARTVEQQKLLYAKGRTAPGVIVTNADGVTHKSNHQTREDGYGHAVDCAFFVAGAPSWDDTLPWDLFGAMAKSQGLIWGGEFHSITDKPHVELS